MGGKRKSRKTPLRSRCSCDRTKWGEDRQSSS
jgi:hypothetical protein